MLEGHIGVVFAEVDLLQTTKVVFKFRQDNEEVLEVIGGRYEGMLYSAKDIEALSQQVAELSDAVRALLAQEKRAGVRAPVVMMSGSESPARAHAAPSDLSAHHGG